MKHNHTLFFVVGIGAVVVLLNLVSLQGFFRLDLTTDKKFTLGRASVETVQGLADTVTVSAYFSEDLPPPYAQHARYVKDLLEEYLAASEGHFAFEFSDPTMLETEADRAKKKETKHDIFGRVIREPTSVESELAELGLQPVEIQVIEEDQQKRKRAYMGLVIRYQDKHEVIPVVQNLSDLEKDITSLMRKLTRTKEPKIGLVHDLSAPSLEKMTSAMRQNMTIENLDLKSEGDIPSDFDAVLVVGGGDYLGDRAASKLDTYLRTGKSAAVFLDRFNVDPRSFQQHPISPQNKVHDLFNLLKSYGIEIEPSLVADASCASLNMQESRGTFTFSLPVKYPFVPELMNLSFESPITKGLSGIILPFVSKITVTPKDGFKVDVLARSSKVSWIEKEPLDLNPRRNWGESDIVPDGPHALMVEGRGILPISEENPPTGQAVINPAESRLVVVGTSAFVWDDFLTGANQVLALNIVDWMLADNALLEMRAREFADVPLDTNLSDATRQSVKFGNILGVPFLLVLYGLIRWRLRESRRRSLKLGRA